MSEKDTGPVMVIVAGPNGSGKIRWTPSVGQLRDEVGALLLYSRETLYETEKKIA